MAEPQWLSIRLVREIIYRLNRGWTSLPARARRAWWRTLALGIAVTCAFNVVLVSAVRSWDARGGFAWEADTMAAIDRSAPFSFSTAMWLEGIGNGFVLWALVLCAAAFAAWRYAPLVALSLLVGHTFVYVHIALAWSLWDRARPRSVLDGLAAPAPPFHSFPSGHMMQTVFPLGLLVFLWARGTPRRPERLAAAAILVGLILVVAAGRLRIGVHWPSDIAGGILIGSAWLIAVLAALQAGETQAVSA